jgi:hypothetical protein
MIGQDAGPGGFGPGGVYPGGGESSRGGASPGGGMIPRSWSRVDKTEQTEQTEMVSGRECLQDLCSFSLLY